MINLNEIHSVTDFVRNAKTHIARLKKTGMPQVLTINGSAELVVQDARTYQSLLERLDRAEAIAGIRQGLKDVEEGRTTPADQVLNNMRERLNIPPQA